MTAMEPVTAPRKKGKVFLVTVEPPAQYAFLPTVEEHIVSTLSRGNRTTRYGREWIIGRTYREGNLLTGRIGFRGAEGMAEVWDDSTNDFTNIAVPAGLTAPFAVNLQTLKMALQPRGAEIKLNALIGAFRALLSETGDPWRIYVPEHEMTFTQWRSSVTRVTSVRFRLRQPNPHWRGTPDLEAVMSQAVAEVVTLEMQSKDGIDTDAPFVAQSQVHAEKQYGHARYIGEREEDGQVRETVYNTSIGAEEEALEVPVEPDGEVSLEHLGETLVEGAQVEDN